MARLIERAENGQVMIAGCGGNCKHEYKYCNNAMPYGTNRLFVNQMVNGAWVGWEEYAQNSELNKKASNLVYSVAVGETLTILNDELPKAYICATKGMAGNAQSVIVGSGYGATDVRHKITELISGTSITYAVNKDTYGLSMVFLI